MRLLLARGGGYFRAAELLRPVTSTPRLHLPEIHRLRIPVLEMRETAVVAGNDTCRARKFALSFTVVVHSQLHEREGVVDRARLIDRFPHADWAIRREENPAAAVFSAHLMRVVQIPPEIPRGSDEAQAGQVA